MNNNKLDAAIATEKTACRNYINGCTTARALIDTGMDSNKADDMVSKLASQWEHARINLRNVRRNIVGMPSVSWE
jgi:hypothetical protein